jgi:hypothetical protein
LQQQRKDLKASKIEMALSLCVKPLLSLPTTVEQLG